MIWPANKIRKNRTMIEKPGQIAQCIFRPFYSTTNGDIEEDLQIKFLSPFTIGFHRHLNILCQTINHSTSQTKVLLISL